MKPDPPSCSGPRPMTHLPIRFRPHHFLCALGYEGKGYSPEFTANMTAIVVGRLRAPGGEAEVIEVTREADAICAPCPARRGTGCESGERIAALDAAHAAALELAAGERLTWGAALGRMRALPPDIHRSICAPCPWRALGLCAAALARLQAGACGLSPLARTDGL